MMLLIFGSPRPFSLLRCQEKIDDLSSTKDKLSAKAVGEFTPRHTTMQRPWVCGKEDLAPGGQEVVGVRDSEELPP